MRRASWMSFGMMVTRLAWMAHRFVSSKMPTRYASAARKHLVCVSCPRPPGGPARRTAEIAGPLCNLGRSRQQAAGDRRPPGRVPTAGRGAAGSRAGAGCRPAAVTRSPWTSGLSGFPGVSRLCGGTTGWVQGHRPRTEAMRLLHTILCCLCCQLLSGRFERLRATQQVTGSSPPVLFRAVCFVLAIHAVSNRTITPR